MSNINLIAIPCREHEVVIFLEETDTAHRIDQAIDNNAAYFICGNIIAVNSIMCAAIILHTESVEENAKAR